MKDKLFKFVFIFIICSVLLFLIIIFINSKKFYYDAIDNIKINYNNIMKKENVFLDDNYYYSANLKTEHTSNLVHSINQVYEKNYDFILEKKEDYIYVYLDDMVSKISVDNFNDIFDISKINYCIYLNKEDIELDDKDRKVNKFNYLCDKYEFFIYTSKIFNKYIKSEIIYNDVIIEIKDNIVNFSNDSLSLKYSNIRSDNYVMNFNYNDKEFDIFYTYNKYDKFSFIYNNYKVSLIIDKDIVLLINCDTRRYSKLELTLSDKDINLSDKYNEVNIDELMALVFSSEIYSLFE